MDLKMNKAFLRAINIKMVVQCFKKKRMNQTIPFLNYCCTYVTQVKCVKTKPAVEVQYLDLLCILIFLTNITPHYLYLSLC